MLDTTAEAFNVTIFFRNDYSLVNYTFSTIRLFAAYIVCFVNLWIIKAKQKSIIFQICRVSENKGLIENYFYLALNGMEEGKKDKEKDSY